jgi:arylsulfatase A-like enzyme
MPSLSRRGFLQSLATSAGVALAAPLLPAAPERKPNFVFFLVDDMGWMDSSVYGSEYYETPNMARLAKRSVRFTNAYTASPLCSPTRATLMSGQYPARTGITTAVGHRPPLPADTSRYPEKTGPTRPVVYANSRRFLKPAQFTLAEALRGAGYHTAHIGKWHLGLPPEYWPEKQGFEVSFHGAPDPGPPSYHSPYGFKAGTVTDGPEGEYITDRITAEAIRFIKANRDQPFYLNLWQYGVHGPWGHKEEYTRYFAKKKDPRGFQNNPIMASMLKSVDDSLGRVLDTLTELGLMDDTVIVFFSDNGGNTHSRTETDARSERVFKNPKHPKHADMVDYRHWAGYNAPTNNAPLRLGKGTLYEGGIRVPLMVYWPGMVDPNTVDSTVVVSPDIYPTVLDMLGIPRNPDQVVDGQSLVPVLRHTGKLAREAVFFYFPHKLGERPGGVAVRRGDWKLIHWFETNATYPSEFELYNLREDIGETTNLAAKQPQLVAELNALANQHLKTCGALVPKPNPAYDPRTLPIDGWQCLRFTTIKKAAGALQMVSTESRTQMQNRTVKPAEGKLRVQFRMRGKQGPGGIFYWSSDRNPQFVRERRVEFKNTFDGEWHEYDLAFAPEGKLNGLRLDACMQPTTVEIDWIRVRKEDGTLVQEWTFD